MSQMPTEEPLLPGIDEDEEAPPTGLLAALAWYARRKPVFTGGNEVALLRGGRALFPAMCEHIEQAQRSIWVALYIVCPHGQSTEVLQALTRAAQRGVRVTMVVDGVGCRDVPAAVWRTLTDAGVQLVVYKPLHWLWGLLDAGQWRRMHLKLCVIDDDLAFIGGINLIDDHYDLGHGWTENPRLDYAVSVRGPVVMPVLHTIRAMWARAKFGRDWRDDLIQWVQDRDKLHKLRHKWQTAMLRLSPQEKQKLIGEGDTDLPMRSAFVLRDNLRQRRTIEQASLRAIVQAQTRIDIVTPYFYPRRAMRRALREAAARGVRVRLLLQGKLDYQIAGIAAQVLYSELQQQGVHIFEYQPAFLHAKVLCVDDEWATVGSSNLDPLSMVLNLEGNLIVRDRGFVQTLSDSLDADFAQSREVPPPDTLHDRRWRTRARRAVVAFAAKSYLRLAGVVGRY